MLMRDFKTELAARLAQTAGVLAFAALFYWVDREGADGVLTGGREWLWGGALAAGLAVWHGWLFGHFQRNRPDSQMDRIILPKFKYAAADPEEMRSRALKLLADHRVFNLRYASPPPPGLLPDSLPSEVRRLLSEYSLVALAHASGVYLSREAVGRSKLAPKAVLIGYNWENEVVCFPGEEYVYEMFAHEADYSDRLVLTVKDKGIKYLGVHNWLVSAAHEHSREVTEELMKLADEIIAEAEREGEI